MIFTLQPDRLAIVRLPATSPVPQWADGGSFFSITRTSDELSIVCRGASVPAGSQADRGWQCLKLDGPIPLNTVGVAAEFTSILARAGISLFLIATYDTDYVLVRGDAVERTVEALRTAGHTVRSS